MTGMLPPSETERTQAYTACLCYVAAFLLLVIFAAVNGCQPLTKAAPPQAETRKGK